jgi:hypothetical protein
VRGLHFTNIDSTKTESLIDSGIATPIKSMQEEELHSKVGEEEQVQEERVEEGVQTEEITEIIAETLNEAKPIEKPAAGLPSFRNAVQPSNTAASTRYRSHFTSSIVFGDE